MAVSTSNDHFAAGVRLEEALEASQALLHALLEEVGRIGDAAQRRDAVARALQLFPVPAAVFDGDGASGMTANARWKTLFRRFDDVPSALGDVLAAARGATGSQRVAELDLHLATHVGHFSVTARPLIGGTLALCLDVTDLRLAARLEVEPGALLFAGTTPRAPAYYSDAWRTAFGGAWADVVHTEDQKRWLAALGQLSGTPRAEADVRMRMRSGEYRSHRLRLRASRDGTWFGFVTDIQAELDRAAERAALVETARTSRDDADRATRTKDEFLAAVSHELRAPLTTLLLWEKVLRENGDDAVARARALDAIHHSAATQARLVADLLDVARGISGKLYLDIRVVDIAQLMTEACDAARPLATAKSLELTLTIGPLTGGLHGDATRLRQIVDNLLSNAIKFTARGGKVAVALARRGRSIAIDVEDTGRGIAPELLARIFEPFAQIDEALARAEGGLGLGLTIARQLAELHRGTLSATSGGLGKGSRFTLSLPSAGTRRAPSPPVGVRRVPRLDGGRVLLIDDDSHVREALALLLERAGMVVETAGSAELGRTLLTAHPPDAVICDIAMPGEDGYTFVSRLRNEQYAMPAIALTAYASGLDAQRAIEAGFDLHLAKPISFERLVTSLSELLAARRASQS